MAYSKQDLQNTVQEYQHGRQSLKKISLEFGIPKTTIWNRIYGSQPHRDASESQQSLSRVQRDYLTQWVLTQVALGVPPTHAQIREFANRVLKAQGSSQSVGNGWVRRSSNEPGPSNPERP